MNVPTVDHRQGHQRNRGVGALAADARPYGQNSIRWAVPLALLLGACGVYRIAASSQRPDDLEQLIAHPAVARAAPNQIAPRYDLRVVATDAQLHAVMDRMKPTLDPVDTNLLVHALRLWGPDAEFDDPAHPDGATLLAYFLDDVTFQELAGPSTPPLFSLSDNGVAVRSWEQNAQYQRTGAVHVDDLLATLSESGVPLSTPLVTREGRATVGELLESALRSFHRRQHEYEWTSISYARFVFPANRWRNQYGSLLDATEIVDELIEQPAANGVCMGTHRLEALSVLNRADEQHQALSTHTRRKLLDRLTHTSAILIQSQSVEGYWNRSWHRGAEAAAEPPGSIYDRVLATGHHLEWLAFAPPEVLPPRETIVRAGQWLVRTMLEADQDLLDRHYGPMSHAARALCLWRGTDPYSAWRANPSAGLGLGRDDETTENEGN